MKKIILWLLSAMATITFDSCVNEEELKQEVTSISLDTLTLTLAINHEYTFAVTVLPENATDKTVIWTSNADAIASVSNGKVTAISKGTATITAKAGNQTDSCIVTVMTPDPLTYDEGVVINGIKWATRNVDAPGTFAANPEDAGMFYRWNSKKAWPATGEVTDWETTVSNDRVWTKSNDPSPVGWHVPTLYEILPLLESDQVSQEWTTINGTNGRKFIDKATGNSLFFPAVGSRIPNDGALYSVGLHSACWSNMKYYSDGYTYALNFNSSGAVWLLGYNLYGFSIRSVAD